MSRLSEPSHLDLYCLQKPIIIACGIERVNVQLVLYKLHNFCNASVNIIQVNMIRESILRSFRDYKSNSTIGNHFQIASNSEIERGITEFRNVILRNLCVS